MVKTCQKNSGYGSDVMDVKQEEHLAPLFFLFRPIRMFRNADARQEVEKRKKEEKMEENSGTSNYEVTTI